MKMPCAIIGRDARENPCIRWLTDVDYRNASVIIDAVQAATRWPGEMVVMDLHTLTFIDSSGISALVRAARALRESGRCLQLAGANRHIIRVLRTAGFARFFSFDIEEDWAAVAPVRTPEDRKRQWQHTEFSIPASFERIAYVRNRIADLVRSVPGAEERLDDVCLAVGEAASNAVRHGCACNEALKVHVEARTDGDILWVEIIDPGPGFDPDEVPQPVAGELREGGMGIHFMRLTMDYVAFRFGDNGTTACMWKRLVSDEAEAPAEASRLNPAWCV
jgi:serine/threonine-protein kinase RsbW